MYDERAAPFQILTFIGLWCPMYLGSILKKIVYNVYTISIVSLHCSNTLLQVVETILSAQSMIEIAQSTFMLLTLFSTCIRFVNVLVLRGKIISSMRMLREDPCKPTDLEEQEIQAKYDEIVRWKTVAYTVWVHGSVLFFLINSILRDVKSRQLPFKARYPFDYTSSPIFWIPYLHQVLGIWASAVVHVATDVLIGGFMLQACCQFEILEHRLGRLIRAADERTELRKCAYHHHRIYEYIALINNTFNVTITGQFCAVTFILCTSVVMLLEADLFSLEFLSISIYLANMLVQVYIYCWYGNKITLKSLDLVHTLFGMEWIELNIETQKSLLLMMKRATIPIVLKIAYIVNMNLDSFVDVVKISYSVYNVLKQTDQRKP